MKIAILTHPLWTNYGGILQAYALQTFLQQKGHVVTIVNREPWDYPSIPLFLLRLGSVIKSFVRIYFLGEKQYVVKSPLSPFYNNRWSGYDVLPFVKEYLNQSRELRNSKALKRYLKHNVFDCYIVGSDQVWRPSYVSCITDYFLKEVPTFRKSIKLAYAASFGTDKWEFTSKDTTECARLAKLFDAISVRELSGVSLCKKYFNLDVQHLVDPTMLLDVEDYMKLINQKQTTRCFGNMFCYILDDMSNVHRIIDSMREDGFEPYFASIRITSTVENPRPYQISVEQWLRNFIDTNLVITDSFHACVFSILFKKPFIVWANASRGNTRVESLLELFGMEERLIHSYEDFKTRKNKLLSSGDFANVDIILNREREKSRAFFEQVDIL